MRRWQLILGILISLLFLWLALRGLHLRDFWQALQTARYEWLIPGVILYFLAVILRAWRWHYLLSPLKRVPTRDLFPITAIGYMGNNIYPARAGEVLRAVILKRRYGVSISASLATILVERVFDGVVMLAFVFFNLPELSHLTHDSGVIGNIRQVALGGTVLFIGALLAFLMTAMFPQKALHMVKLVLRYFPEALRHKVLPLAERFLGGLAFLRSPFHVLMVFLTSLGIWLLETGKYWCVMFAFPFRVSFFALMLMNGIVNLATTIPSAPGYVGTFDAPGIAVLRAYGVEQALAAGYTLVLHVALWLPITLLGAFYLTREGIRWQEELRAEVKEER